MHVHTSPHLVRWTSASGSAPRAAAGLSTTPNFAEALEECQRHQGRWPITVFEIPTAVIFCLFVRTSG